MLGNGASMMWAGEDGASCCFMKYRSPHPHAPCPLLCLRFWNHT